MRIVIKTRVAGHHKDIMQRFDRDLFEALAPKVGKMEIVTFTGSKKGDKVHIRFISPIKADWTSLITEDYSDEQQSYFVDEGDVLPFPLSYWKHRHIVERIDDKNSYIIDDIEYKAQNPLLTLFFYPILYFSFLPRRSIYQSYFGQ